MKTRIAFLLFTFHFSLFTFCYCQSQVQQGHFFFETGPLIATYEKTETVTQTSGTGNSYNYDTTRTAVTAEHLGINLGIGYFVGKHLALGLVLDNSEANNYYLFARYYLKHKRPDSAKVDFFIQANTSFGYKSDNEAQRSSGNENSYSDSYSTTSPYPVNTATYYGALRLGVAFHLSTHWALEVSAAAHITFQAANSGSYTVTSYSQSKPGGGGLPPAYVLNGVYSYGNTETTNFNEAINAVVGVHYFL